MKTYANDSAHPYAYEEEVGDHGFKQLQADRGLTKREAFAMAAMQGYLASYPSDSSPNAVNVAKYSVEYADALIEALNKETA